MHLFGKAMPALGGVIAGAMLVSFALPALGRDDPPRTFASGATAPHITKLKAFTAKSSGLKKLRYVASTATAQPSAESGGSLSCPRKYRAISGFFGPEAQEGLGQLALTDSFPSGKSNRNWDIGVKNMSATPQKYFLGVVCVK
jgi:hypothetical protein